MFVVRRPRYQVLLKAVPGGGMGLTPGAHATAAECRSYALEHSKFPLAAFLVVAGPSYLLDYTYVNVI